MSSKNKMTGKQQISKAGIHRLADKIYADELRDHLKKFYKREGIKLPINVDEVSDAQIIAACEKAKDNVADIVATERQLAEVSNALGIPVNFSVTYSSVPGSKGINKTILPTSRN